MSTLVGAIVVGYDAAPRAAAGLNLLTALAMLAIFSVNGGLPALVGMRARMPLSVPRRGLLLAWSASAGFGVLLEFVFGVSGQLVAARAPQLLGLYAAAAVLLVAAARRTVPGAPTAFPAPG